MARGMISVMAFKDRPLFRRILELDDLLRQGKKVNASILSDRFETSVKTAQRLIEYMRNEFDAPIEWDAAGCRYYYSDPDFHLPWLPVDGKDLFAVGVAMKVLQMYDGTPAAADLKVIFDRLSELMPAEVRVSPSTLVEKLHVRQQAGRPIDKGVWEAVAAALREKTVLSIDYLKPTGERRTRDVEPYHLVLANGDWFLLARDPDDGKVKEFYLARIRGAKQTSTRFSPPKGFKPEEFFGESIGAYGGKKPFRFKVRIDAAIAPWVAEVRWHDKQKAVRLPDGALELELPAATILEARRFILSFGKHALAVHPPELVADVKEHVTALAKEYATG